MSRLHAVWCLITIVKTTTSFPQTWLQHEIAQFHEMTSSSQTQISTTQIICMPLTNSCYFFYYYFFSFRKWSFSAKSSKYPVIVVRNRAWAQKRHEFPLHLQFAQLLICCSCFVGQSTQFTKMELKAQISSFGSKILIIRVIFQGA